MSESKPNAWEKFQTYFIVSVIAALIWLYAEDELAKDFQIDVDVRFVAGEGRDLLIDPTGAQGIRLEVRCNSGQYAQLQKALTGPLDLVVKDNGPGGSPTQQVLLKEMISAHERIAELGVSIIDVQPKTVAVNVERLERITLPIAVMPGDRVIAGTPSVDPIQASVKVPASLAEMLDGQRLEVHLRDVPNLDGLPENVAHAVELAIQPPPLLRGYKVTPATARVTFALRSQTDSIKLTTVPVLVVLPSTATTGAYTVEVDPQNQFLRDVELSGPSDVIAAIRDNRIRVNALLYLTTDDLDTGISSKLPQIAVPPGVAVDSTVLPVSFTIRRTPPAPAVNGALGP